MNSEQAAHLVDKWAREWRQYLDGMLHKYPRQALIDLLVAVSVDSDASEDVEGRTAAFDVKAISAKVRADDIAKRATSAVPGPVRFMSAAEAAALQSFEPLTVKHLDAMKTDAKRLMSDDSDLPSVPSVDVGAARDAFTLLQEAHAGRVLHLTERQVERFTAAGLLTGVAYEVSEPLQTLSDTVDDRVAAAIASTRPQAEKPGKVGRRAKRR